MARKKKITEDAKVSEAPEAPAEAPVSPKPAVPAKPEPAPVGDWPRLPPWLLPTVKDELDDPFGMVGFID